MEEVDQIILHSLANIGCEFASGMESLKQLNTENVIEGTVKCLKIINPEFKMSHIFPPGMSARFRVGTAIAQECQNAGYRGSMGYQTFLYSSEIDIRKIFMFLVEKLPRKEGVKEDAGSDSVLNKRIGQVLREHCAKAWMPFYCTPRKNNGVLFRTQSLQIPTYDKKAAENSEESNVLFVHHQITNKETLTPSLLELNVHQVSNKILEQTSKKNVKNMKFDSYWWQQPNLVGSNSISEPVSFSSSLEDVISSITGQTQQAKNSRFLNAKKLQFTKSEPVLTVKVTKRPTIAKKPQHLLKSEKMNDKMDKIQAIQNQTSNLVNGDIATEEDEVVSVEMEEEKFAREEEALQDLIEATENKQENFKEQIKMVQTSIQQMKLEIGDLEALNTNLKESIIIKEKTVKLLPNAEENIEKLQNLIESNKERLVGLGKMWEERKIPMIEEIQTLKDKFNVSEVDVDLKMEEIKILRRRMKETSEETKKKEQTIKQLKTELSSMTQDISRQSYTCRILEIVASIHKQQDEIRRVINDINNMQKIINQQRGRIDRTFTAADEIMFKDAKTDDGVRQAYKYLVALHDSCTDLLQTVTDTGSIIREIRELEDQVDIELNKNAEENLKKIVKDYKEMKKENSDLIKQIKSQK